MSKAKDMRDAMRVYMRMLMTRGKPESIYHEYVYIVTFNHKTTRGHRISFLCAPNKYNPIIITGCRNQYKFNGILEPNPQVFHSRIIL